MNDQVARHQLKANFFLADTMANGSRGDHPYTDIVLHQVPVYSPTADTLVREIVALAGQKERDALADMLISEYSPYSKPDVTKLERVLQEKRDQLREEAIRSGWGLRHE